MFHPPVGVMWIAGCGSVVSCFIVVVVLWVTGPAGTTL